MTLDDLAQYFDNLGEQVAAAAPDIIAETAVTYYKNAFSKKAFNKSAWAPATVTKNRGSLLIDSGALMNSVEPALINRQQVIIQAGNDKVGYAQVHNEGYTGPVSIPAHSRNTKHGTVEVSGHTRNVDIPQRQFMGEADELNTQLRNRLEGFVKSIT